jgi:hypothetical protein
MTNQTDLMSDITSIQDARFLKRVGLPLNTPVEHRTFSAGYCHRWFKMLGANQRFVRALIKYGESDGDEGAWRKVKRAFEKLVSAVSHFIEYGELTDDAEHAIIQAFVQQRFLPMSKRWNALVDGFDAGEGMAVNLQDFILADAAD